MGDDILVFSILIPLWPDYLDHLDQVSHERVLEDKSRFKEICNSVLCPNDPILESGYQVISHLDFDKEADFSLQFLLAEKRFSWVITPASKQRYLQFRIGQIASARAEAQRQAREANEVHDNPDGSAPGGGVDGNDTESLVLVVQRQMPLEDLCRQLGVTGFGNECANLLGGVTVLFGGDSGAEVGVDEGGPLREAVPLMFSELIAVGCGLFELREDEEARTVEPRWCAADLVPDYQAQFELCGILIGITLVYQGYSPVRFSRCFLKHLLKQERVPEDVPGLSAQLTMVSAAAAAEDDTLASFFLTFSVNDVTTGYMKELLPGGADVSVTQDNVQEYITLRTGWELDGRFQSVMPHVQRGLQRIIPADVMASFSAMVNSDELDVLLPGHGINTTDWRDHTEYYGYDENSEIVKWFWEAVEGFTCQEHEDLWTFISGSKGVPPGGFGHLTNAAGQAVRFTIAKVESSLDHLPVAHTCGFQLDLAQYTSSEDLTCKLRRAMSHRQGFGLA